MSGAPVLLALLVALQAPPTSDPTLPPSSSRADRGLPPMDPHCESADTFGGSVLERSGWCLVREWRFSGVRTLAERAVDQDPQSYRGHLLLGLAFHLGEGNLPKALNHMERAEALYNAQERARPSKDSSEWFVLRLILLETVSLSGEMNLHEQQLAYVDHIRDRLDLNLIALKAWPLVKLRRFDEARAVSMAAVELTGPENQDQREDGATALCAVESELQRREEAYAACRAAAAPFLEEGRTDGGVFLVNLAIAAGEMLRFDEAERVLLESTRRRVESTINPWGNLTHLYLRQGRLAEALDAWRQMQRYRARRPPHMAQQDQAQAELVGATMLMLAGHTEDAERVTSRVVDQPERLGASSASQEQHLAANQLMSRVMHLEVAARLREESAISDWKDALELHVRALTHQLRAWAAGRAAARYLQDDHLLASTLRADCPGSVEIPVWLKGNVVDVVGGGVALAAIARAVAAERLPTELAGPYTDAFAAEAQWRRGDATGALETAHKALAGLGRQELMLRARVSVVGFAAASQLGKTQDALALAEDALRVEPGMFRRVGVRIPVTLQASGEPAAQAAIRLLQGSPLLDVVPWGFTINVSSQALFLEQADGTTVLQAEVPPGDDENEATSARRMARAVHQRLFHPRVDVTQGDVRSLDGGLGGGAALREETHNILQQMTRPEPGRRPR